MKGYDAFDLIKDLADTTGDLESESEIYRKAVYHLTQNMTEEEIRVAMMELQADVRDCNALDEMAEDEPDNAHSKAYLRLKEAVDGY